MPKNNLSFFDEKRCAVKTQTNWGCWWQTVQEVHIQVKVPEKTSSKNIKVEVKPKYIQCIVKEVVIFEGALAGTVYVDDVIWTIEDSNLCIVLTKADYSVKESMWESLLAGGQYQPDTWTLHEIRKNLDLERFQLENPGMDFSGAKLAKSYDKLPGWSNDRLAEIKAKERNEEVKELKESDNI